MKKAILIFLSILSVVFFSNAQSTMKQCCQAPSASATFAALGADASFRNAHESPLPLNYAEKGKMISYPTPDGKTANAYFVPAASKSDYYLVVVHEWWGLNDWIKKQSDFYADSVKNVNVIAIDLYDGKTATTSEDATKLMQGMNEERAVTIFKGAMNYVGKNAKIATIGWCFGGGWALQGALMADGQTIGCVMNYGMPETDVAKLKTLNSDVLFIWASKDKWINEQVKNDFIKNMKDAGKKLTVKEYDADHAFANPSNPNYQSAAAADAQKVTLRYLKGVFKV
jgi:carboxymethylenebutenolidase